MISTDKHLVNIILNQCIMNGVSRFVLSPGSRNAPFSIALDAIASIECVVVHDERCAAFFALGMAQQEGRPVGLICTSGSAALNYYPAIAEAYYQCVPLVVITSDRPYEWVDQGDGQTIRQQNVFQGHVRYSAHFEETLYTLDQSWYVERETAIAFSEGNGLWKGPIHFNVGLREPLYQTGLIVEAPSTRIISSESSSFHPSAQTYSHILEGLSFSKKMIIVGQMPPNQDVFNELIKFVADTSVAILVENTSNMFDVRFIASIDRALNRISDAELIEFAPDLLITLGGAVVSKRIKAFLRKNQPVYHWKVGGEFPFMDTYQCLTHSFQTEPCSFFKLLNTVSYKRSTSNFGDKWRQLDHLSRIKMPLFFEDVAYADLRVFQMIFETLPDKCQLHMGNSSVVRYCQLFDPKPSVTYWSNRGTSGIEGSMSTAAGASYCKPEQLHVLLIGDISFFYDSNALWNGYLKSNFRIVLINNGGGGIFRIIPGASDSPQLEQYFEASHNHSAKGICEAYHVSYDAVHSDQELFEKLVLLFSPKTTQTPCLLEVYTPQLTNARVLEQFFQFLKE
jgi:2-succinyl-5-enolpyruvyl-6-hydroxy-3-cyclohexene-1-carboxylate synthase